MGTSPFRTGRYDHVMNAAHRRFAAVVVSLLLIAACSESKPNEKQARSDLQRMLDGMNRGFWRIDKVKRTNGRFTTHDGTRAYIMEADIDVTLMRSVRRDELVARGLKLIIDLFEGKTWLLSFVGPAGERKTVSLPLLWIEKDRGWEFVGPCPTCS